MKYLSTSALAKATGVHPNTVRRYTTRVAKRAKHG